MTRTFEKDFREFDTQLKKRLDFAIRNLQANPHLGKPLKGELSGKWSLRIGDYRILYIIDR